VKRSTNDNETHHRASMMAFLQEMAMTIIKGPVTTRLSSARLYRPHLRPSVRPSLYSKTSGQSHLAKRSHRRRVWTVPSYSPDGANVHSRLMHASMDPTRVHIRNGISIASAVFADRQPDHTSPSVAISRTRTSLLHTSILLLVRCKIVPNNLLNNLRALLSLRSNVKDSA